MSSGAVLGTMSTTSCEPSFCSISAKRCSMAPRWDASSVPVWSITRADNAGTASSVSAWL
ncbi:MAG: hypothetical protein V9G23_10975 [Giesbergeria sp.]